MIPDVVARRIIKSAKKTLTEKLKACLDDANNFKQLDQKYPGSWDVRRLIKKSGKNPFHNYKSRGGVALEARMIRVALQIYILFFTGMRSNELINLKSDCCSIHPDGNTCEIRGNICKGSNLRHKRTFIWFAPGELKEIIDNYLELMRFLDRDLEYLFSRFKGLKPGRVKANTVTRELRDYCTKYNLLETRDGAKWDIKAHQFRVYFVHFMTQNHLNFSIISEQLKHTLLDQTFGYSGSLEGSMATTFDTELLYNLEKGKMAYNWAEAEKALCCETVTCASPHPLDH